MTTAESLGYPTGPAATLPRRAVPDELVAHLHVRELTAR
jgi:hypothetical protein